MLKYFTLHDVRLITHRTFLALVFCLPLGSTFAAESAPALRIGLLPDTQGGGFNVAIHPMEAVLAKLAAENVNIVIAVGDLTDNGSSREFAQWDSVARKYRDQGIEFIPLMGNHEDSFAYAVEWIDVMQDYIPRDAVHMSGTEYLNYYVVRGNVMIVALRYYHLAVSFEWLKNAVEQHRDDVEHIIIASHDGLIGAKYGQTRETIVEGQKDSNLLFDRWDEIRHFFARHDVIWVQGHEHMYQRSVIKAPVGLEPGSWTLADGNYRLPQYTQIISGNASYKGYEFRYGEREKVQAIIQHKMNTMLEGSTAYDANASLFTFRGPRVDYQSWFTEHTLKHNDDGPGKLQAPQWQLLDRFSRTSDRCERLVYPNSIPEGTRPVMTLDPLYRSNDCFASDGSVAKMIDGINNTFNRVDSTAESLSWRDGFSRAESQNDLMRLAYQFLFQFHQRWTPNLNGNQRIIADPDHPQLVRVPATTIDMKEHVTLSWLDAEPGTVSDILIVSGTQIQTGTYSSAFGAEKNIETEPGLPNSQPDGGRKLPVVLPANATRQWDLVEAKSDKYVIRFDAPDTLDFSDTVLGYRTSDGGWQALVSGECVLSASYDSSFLNETWEHLKEGCERSPLVGRVPGQQERWWAVLDQDLELALIPAKI